MVALCDPSRFIYERKYFITRYYTYDRIERSNDYLDKLDKQAKVTMREMTQRVSDDFVALLPRIMNGIQEMREKSYFDFASKSYIPVGKGFDCIGLTKAEDEILKINVPLSRQGGTLGYIIPPAYPKGDDRTKEEIERAHARIDGKKICNYLRQLRMELAKDLRIMFFPIRKRNQKGFQNAKFLSFC